MGHGDYEKLTPETIDALWLRLREGHGAKPTARQLGLSPSTVRTYLLRCGGVRPDPRCRARCRLTMAEREEISRGLAAGQSTRAIATRFGRAPSTVDDEHRTRKTSAAVRTHVQLARCAGIRDTVAGARGPGPNG